jgi:hypothetical protein
MYEKYDKAGYALSTGVGGFYTANQTDVDGGIYVRTTYKISEIKLNEDYEGVALYNTEYATANKEMYVLAEKGYVFFFSLLQRTIFFSSIPSFVYSFPTRWNSQIPGLLFGKNGCPSMGHSFLC